MAFISGQQQTGIHYKDIKRQSFEVMEETEIYHWRWPLVAADGGESFPLFALFPLVKNFCLRVLCVFVVKIWGKGAGMRSSVRCRSQQSQPIFSKSSRKSTFGTLKTRSYTSAAPPSAELSLPKADTVISRSSTVGKCRSFKRRLTSNSTNGKSSERPPASTTNLGLKRSARFRIARVSHSPQA